MPIEGGTRVLIADTDPGLRRQLQKRLLDAKVPSDCVTDGRAAAAKLREQSYAVVVVDLELPPITAEAILESIRGVNAEARPVVLVLAAASVARSIDVDVVQIVLRKPCNIAQLADLVRSCVNAASRLANPIVPVEPGFKPQLAG